MASLKREVGLVGAVGIGLGSILGTGVFVALAIAAGEAGPWLPLAVLLGGVVATLNGLSSAQLAAVHPVAGGTYAYGRRFLHPYAGFLAGVTFLAAKSASAATAALGVAGYLTLALDLPGYLRVPIAAFAVLALAWLVNRGARRTSAWNLLLVGVTLTGLGVFVVTGLLAAAEAAGWTVAASNTDRATASWPTLRSVAYATALAFVAYTGYGRVATLGEEVRDPRRVIPRAVIVTLLVSAVTYLAVAAVGLLTVGADGMAAASEGVAAPLTTMARAFEGPAGGGVQVTLAVAAMTAMLGVLLNLLLGLSRVAFAMGRDGEAPAVLARLDADGTSPKVAVWAVAGVILALVLTGDVRLTWSFSALTVLLYYGLANASALRVAEDRFVPRWVSLAGLAACLSLTVFVPGATWLAALLLVAVATGLRFALHRGANDAI